MKLSKIVLPGIVALCAFVLSACNFGANKLLTDEVTTGDMNGLEISLEIRDTLKVPDMDESSAPEGESTDDVTEHRHKYGKWNVIRVENCLEAGVQARYCECGEAETRTIDRTDHIPGEFTVVLEAGERSEGISRQSCINCGMVYAEKSIHAKGSKGLTYELNSDGYTYMVTGIGTCTDTDLYIGSGYDGKEVTAIKKGAFQDCTQLTSITIGGNIVRINSNAFENCENVKSIMVCNGVTNIGSRAFGYCKSLEAIVIPDSVASLTARVFEGCTALTSVTLGAGITKINSLFRDCVRLETIIIPEGVTDLGANAFFGCEMLTEVVLPSTLTSIGATVFKNCLNIRDIVFSGTMAEWNAISKDANWDSDCGQYRIHCTDGTIEKGA